MYMYVKKRERNRQRESLKESIIIATSSSLAQLQPWWELNRTAAQAKQLLLACNQQSQVVNNAAALCAVRLD